MPIARAMPSSPRRSAASITKIRKISRMPAAIENEPKVVNIDMNAAPAVSAASSASCFACRRPRARAAPGSAAAARTTWSVSARAVVGAAAVGDEHLP